MAYALDLTATLPANYITTTHLRGNGPWIFVPTGGAFFTKDLVIKNTLNNQILEPQLQYRALHVSKDAIMASGKEVCCVIVILDSSINEISLQRRVVGGVYQNVGSDLDQIITDTDLDNLNSTSWGQVIGEPYQYPFDPHFHYVEDIYGLEHVIYLIESIAKAVSDGDGNVFGMMYQFIDKQVSELTAETDTRLNQLSAELAQLDADRKWKPGVIIAMKNNTNPAVALGYGTWRKLTNTLLYGVSNDVNLGQLKKVGEGVDYLMTGIYYWELLSV